jgi:hypothetical protein
MAPTTYVLVRAGLALKEIDTPHDAIDRRLFALVAVVALVAVAASLLRRRLERRIDDVLSD